MNEKKTKSSKKIVLKIAMSMINDSSIQRTYLTPRLDSMENRNPRIYRRQESIGSWHPSP